ncbi:MAG TPA: (Fe-S)-binding protein [Anaerolineae bacterium]|nr:(Fe-S)-binding protein [Anaerolineae bacterium]
MLIDDYELTLTSPPCDPGSATWSAFAALDTDISETFPYLNAVWPDAVYDHASKVLTRRSHGHAMFVRPREIGVSDVADRADGARMLEEIINEVNRTWERRDEIQPDYTRRTRATPMDIYRLLPKTNCKACGQPTCFTFALQVAAGNMDLSACDLLGSSEFARQRRRLQGPLGTD